MAATSALSQESNRLIEAAKDEIEAEKDRLGLMLQRQKELIACFDGKGSGGMGSMAHSFASTTTRETAMGECVAGSYAQEADIRVGGREEGGEAEVRGESGGGG